MENPPRGPVAGRCSAHARSPAGTTVDVTRHIGGCSTSSAWTFEGTTVDVVASTSAGFAEHLKISATFAPTAVRLGPMTEPNRYSLRSKLLEATNVERAKCRYRKISKAEWDDIFDPCRWREPVFAWLLANWEQVFKARTRLEMSARLEWKDIARIMELDGVKGSRGEPPNANSVRRVWDRVVIYLERDEDLRTTRGRWRAGLARHTE